jgi:CheY-like chemotaxis protein
MHGGKLQASSPGDENGFELVLRLHALVPPAEATAEGAGGDRSVRGSSSRRVLLVDDNIDLAQTLGWMLEAAGHQVRLAYDGEEALIAAREFQPEVCLLDIGLPGMDGYELARRLRQEYAEKPLLVAVTGYGQDEYRRKALESGFEHHLVKPVNPGDLLALVAEAPRR